MLRPLTTCLSLVMLKRKAVSCIAYVNKMFVFRHFNKSNRQLIKPVCFNLVITCRTLASEGYAPENEPYLERIGKNEESNRRPRSKSASVDDFDLDLSGLKETMGKWSMLSYVVIITHYVTWNQGSYKDISCSYKDISCSYMDTSGMYTDTRCPYIDTRCLYIDTRCPYKDILWPSRI